MAEPCSPAQHQFGLVADLLDQATYNEPTGRKLHFALAELGQLCGWCGYDRHRSRRDTRPAGATPAGRAPHSAGSIHLAEALAQSGPQQDPDSAAEPYILAIDLTGPDTGAGAGAGRADTRPGHAVRMLSCVFFTLFWNFDFIANNSYIKAHYSCHLIEKARARHKPLQARGSRHAAIMPCSLEKFAEAILDDPEYIYRLIRSIDSQEDWFLR